MANRTKNAGIKDIARALNVSIGTVDRALHGRTGVSPETKARILQMADRLGYKPNLAAQALKLNKSLSIGVVLPKHISYFFDPLRAGIRAAAAAIPGMRINLEFQEYPRIGTGDEEALGAVFHRRYDGVIFLPGNNTRFAPLIHKIAGTGTAMMCVGSDAPETDRIGSVAVDAYVSGGIAAELLSYKLSQRANVAVFSGELSTLDHAEKLRGFRETLSKYSPQLTLLHTLESHERPKEAYLQAMSLMGARDRPEGLYLSTANSMPVLKAIEELGLTRSVHVITTDLFRDLVPRIESGIVLASLYQRPYAQGKIAFEKLIAYLLKEDQSNMVVRLPPHVVFRSNLSLFTGHIIDAEEESDAEFLPA